MLSKPVPIGATSNGTRYIEAFHLGSVLSHVFALLCVFRQMLPSVVPPVVHTIQVDEEEKIYILFYFYRNKGKELQKHTFILNYEVLRVTKS